MNDVIERLEKLEKLVEELAKQPQQFPTYPSINIGCQHRRACPSHLVVLQPTTLRCPDCGESITIYPSSPFIGTM